METTPTSKGTAGIWILGALSIFMILQVPLVSPAFPQDSKEC